MLQSKSPFRGQEYDFIIAGAGCAGLSLLVHMIDSGKFADKKILLVDKEEKNKNDRTWCFWEPMPGLFEPVVFKQWKKMWYHDEDFSRLMDIHPYTYKMIRGIDFYNYCLDVIRRQKNIELLLGHVEELKSEKDRAVLKAGGNTFTAGFIFNSILFNKPVLKKNEYYMLQHFKGWIIETSQPHFHPEEATMMDFRMPQQGGITFMYVMPFTETKALVEYTLFTENILPQQEYDEALRLYIAGQLKIDAYRVLSEEWGIIPMTNYRFPAREGRIINIGSAGGQTKPSSGYTFRFIQKHSGQLVRQLLKAGHPYVNTHSGRFHFYDSVLLNILHHKKLSGPEIFTPIIRKNKPAHMLRFLDNESSFAEELKIFSSLPVLPFLKTALHQL
jgi:lycopene beta-cyclase